MDHHTPPYTLFHCVGDAQALRIIVSHAIVCVLYFWIALGRFMPAALAAKTRMGKIVWWSIAVIFPFCALAGYMTTIMAGWCPAIAYPTKEIMSHLDVVACIVFILSTRKHNLQAVGDDAFRDDIEKLISSCPPGDLFKRIKERL